VHRKLLFETLRLDPARDFPTVETLGNTGSAALPVSFSLAEEAGFLGRGQRVAMLGIGSGLSSLMLGVEGA
jgi:3-oxoacyl-[acyl-carrier-protein] synthase-3